MKQLLDLGAIAIAFSSLTLTLAASDSPPTRRPCTVKSPITGSFFDLNSIAIKADDDAKSKGGKSKNGDSVESWHANGYDYGANFTLNFCAPVVEELSDVVGLTSKYWGNVSAYYEKDGFTYSIGQFNDEPFLRGRKLILNYTGGSACDGTQSPSDRTPSRSLPLSNDVTSPVEGREIKPAPTHKSPSKHHDEDEDEDEDDRKDKEDERPSKDKAARRKSTVISLLCDRDPLAPKAAVAFVSSSPDECTYFFEVRSPAACGGKDSGSGGLGPGGVFAVIALIALLVYLVGGCVYQRTVMHQRGWRQLPNYAFWSSIVSFFSDMSVILCSSCLRFMPSRRGYSRLAANGNTRGHRSDSEDENRLIDQLDEEWDD